MPLITPDPVGTLPIASSSAPTLSISPVMDASIGLVDASVADVRLDAILASTVYFLVIDGSGATDVMPVIQAAYDRGHRTIYLIPVHGFLPYVNSPFFDDVNSNSMTFRLFCAGFTFILGTGLPTCQDFEDFALANGISAGTRWMFFSNTKRIAWDGLPGSAVTCQGHVATSAAGGKEKPRFEIHGGKFDGTALPNGGGVIMGNKSASKFYSVLGIKMRTFLSWVSYSDGNGVHDYSMTSPFVDTYACIAMTNGDTVIVSAGVGGGSGVFFRNTHGFVVNGNVGGWNYCNEAYGVFLSLHCEGDQAAAKAPGVTINKGSVSVRHGQLNSARTNDTGIPGAIYIVDDLDDYEWGETLIERVVFRTQWKDNDDPDILRQPDIYIGQMNTNHVLTLSRCRSTISGNGESTRNPGALYIASADPLIQAAIDLYLPKLVWDSALYYENGSWFIGAAGGGPSLVRKTLAPTWNGSGVTDYSGANGGTLSKTKFHAYLMATRNVAGQYSAYGVPDSIKPSSNGAVRINATLPVSGSVVLWHYASTVSNNDAKLQILNTPDSYIELPILGGDFRIVDSGTVNGQLWKTSGIPVPSAVAAVDHTVNGVLLNDGTILS